MSFLPGFLDVAGQILRRPVSAKDVPAALRDVARMGLSLPGDTLSLAGKGTGPFAADVATLVAAAEAWMAGDLVLIGPPRSCGIPALAELVCDVDEGAFREVARDVAERFGSRTMFLDAGEGGTLAIHLALAGMDVAATVATREGGRYRLETRFVPLAAFGGTDIEPARPYDGIDLSRLDALGALEQWRLRTPNASRRPVPGRVLPFPFGPSTFRKFDLLKARNGEPSNLGKAMVRHSLDPLSVPNDLAFRTFVASVRDPAMDAALSTPSMVATADVARLARAHAFFCARPKAEWYAESFRAYPGIGSAVGYLADASTGEDAMHSSEVGGSVLALRNGASNRARASLSAFCRAVDAGGPVLDAWRDALSELAAIPVSKVVARSTADCGDIACWAAWPDIGGALASLEHALGGRPAQRRLTHEEVWAFVRVVDMVAAIASGGGLGEAVTSARYVASNESLAPDDARAVFEALADRSGTCGSPRGDWADALQWIVRRLIRCGISRPSELASALVAVAFPKGRRREALDEMCREWHRLASALDARERALRFRLLSIRAKGFDASRLFPQFPLPDPVPGVARISSFEACETEGREMRHCVGTFGEVAASGEVALFSIRDDDGRSTASLKVELGRDGLVRVRVDQVRSSANAESPSRHVAIVDGLVDAFNSGDRAPYSVAVLAARDAARRLNEAERSLTFADSVSLADAAFESLSPFLTRAVRKGGRVPWVKAVRARTEKELGHG